MQYQIPLFPLPETVLFPRTHLRLYVFESRYREMMETVMATDQRLALAHLREGYQKDYYGTPPVHKMVTTARVLLADRLDDGCWNIAVEGIERGRIEEEIQDTPFRIARVTSIVEEVDPARREDTFLLVSQVSAMAEAIARRVPEARKAVGNLMNNHKHPGIVADIIAGSLVADSYARQSILAETDLERRLQLVRVQVEDLIHELNENGIQVKYSSQD